MRKESVRELKRKKEKYNNKRKRKLWCAFYDRGNKKEIEKRAQNTKTNWKLFLHNFLDIFPMVVVVVFCGKCAFECFLNPKIKTGKK